MRHGGQILVDHLKTEGVTRVFSVPGESFLAALDGLYDSGIQNIVCRQEGGAAMMAEAHGKLTGAPGVLFVTRGPGATNASAGIHVAMQDATPMVVFVGQIARAHRDRGAFQEVDYRAFFGPLAKWSCEVDQTERLPEYLARAFHVARTGRPGPIVIALPEDMLSDVADVPDRPAVPATQGRVSSADAGAMLAAIETSARPLLIAGGPGWDAHTGADLMAFAAQNALPVATAFRRQDYVDNRHPNYVGDLGLGINPGLKAMFDQADTLIVLGSRLGDIVTGSYEMLDPMQTGKRIIHVYPCAEELGRVYHADQTVLATGPAATSALTEHPALSATPWADWAQQGRAAYDAFQTPVETPGPVKLERIMHWLSDTLPNNTIMTNGAGNYATWLHRYFRFKEYGTQLAPTSGSMGYGFPAAVAASLQHPDRTVIAWLGDGEFQMTLNEMSTAVQHGAKPIAIIVNNGRYGTIRMHQERTYPARVSGTEMTNPDFADLARAYGGHGETVTKDEDFEAAFRRAEASGKLAVIELVVDQQVATPGLTLDQLRAQGEEG
ncbi:acetolactate synthase-1/2/3 large subunit [Aliiroseovarius halocynthiae]|uniref:Thiamine pyrophosphate-binding protein n=1 Tax=Aliiroseovarius halocynthiae TaxID=985055 RepID=A0A545SNC9_9RHOB|nr:thiamine pyrophosphate-binding protein [Aliiroseovarius halocynthiae]TQV66475.1 thiamine pyrophosphate-binding protein [Aliiroseovarius halocynthiae]SMR83377.1 acetolactate synthase-1/2/3 large subunit [Aliiroseovarius halocynthiae]